MANLFDKSKKKAPKAKKATEKRIISLAEEAMNATFKRIIELKTEIDTAGGELKTLLASATGEGKRLFVETYVKEQKNPGSFYMATPDGQKVLVVPMERYPKVDEDTQVMLNEVFGEDEDSPVNEETIYSFEPRLLEKYGGVISAMIEASDEIDDDDKEDIFVATTTLAIKKGTIDKLHTLGEGNVEENFELLQPGFQMKNFASE